MVSQKAFGLGIMAVAVALLGSAALADRMDGHDMGGPMGGMGMGGPGMGMPMMMPGFDTLDANKDGKISPDEVTAWRAAQTAGVDANGDGKISVDELAAMRLKQMQAAAQDQAQKMVAARDTDGDGMLSAAEMLAPPMPDALFERIDTNKDGFIDKAEADAAKARMMERMEAGHGKGPGKHHPPMPDAPPAPDGDGGN